MTKSIKKNTILNAIKTFFSIIFPLITFPYASRVLLVDSIGKVNFGLSFVSYFSLLASLGINVYAIRECSKLSDNRDMLSKIASEIFSLNVFAMVFSYALLALFLIFYKEVENYRVLIVVQSFSILLATLGTDWINTAMEDFEYITIRTILFHILSLILLFAFIHSPEDYIKYAAINVVSSGGYNLINIVYRKKYCDIKFTSKVEIKKHYLPIIYLFVMLLSQTIFNNVDMTMLGIMKGDFSVGIYSTAYKISSIITQVISSILWVVMPRISFYYKKNDFNEINVLLKNILYYNTTMGIPCVIGTIMLSKDIIYIIAGSQYLPASLVLQILMLSLFVSLFGGSFIGNIILLPMGEEKYYMKVCVIATMVNIILNRIMIFKWSFAGAAISTLICSILIFALLLFKIDSRIHIENPLSAFYKPFIGGVFVFIVCFFGSQIPDVYFRTFAIIAVSAIGYFLIQLMLKNEICYKFMLEAKNTILNGLYRK